MGYYKPGEYPYTLGRGILRVRKDTEDVWQDLFHIKEFKASIETESIEHENVRSGLKRVDKNVVTKMKAKGGFVVDVPAVENVLLFLMGDAVASVAQSSGSWTAEAFTVDTPDKAQELGKRWITVTAITDDEATPNPLVEGVDYYADWVRGLFTPLSTSALIGAASDGFKITGTYAEKTFKQVKAGEKVINRHLWFAGDAAAGLRQDIRGYAILKPNGDLALIGDEWENFTFDIEWNQHPDYDSPVGFVYDELEAIVE